MKAIDIGIVSAEFLPEPSFFTDELAYRRFCEWLLPRTKQGSATPKKDTSRINTQGRKSSSLDLVLQT
jgi:hypothetical protein